LKVTRWLIYLGPECIELAFRAAHEVDPKAMLVYNENWLGPETSAAEQKRRAVIALLTRLVKKGVPVHALGIQAHIFAGMNVTGAGLKRFLQAVENLGLLILVMELDVRDNSLAGNITVRDAQVAEQYYDFLSFILQFESVKTVLTWGLSDRYSWMTGYIPRKNGLPVRPLLFDAELRPKPAFDAVRRAFEEAPKP
jgi:endo-1,4-beta-xylanase